jgi:hypothetical protein
MQQGSVLVDHCGRLRAAIAIRAAEIESRNAMLTEGAFECGTAIDRFGGVISHSFILVLSSGRRLGQWVCDLRAADSVPASF